MNLLEVEQHGAAWHKARLGNVTASRMADAMSYLSRASNGRKAGESTQKRLDYILEKALERITGKEAWHPVTQPMQDGIDREPWARGAYFAMTGNEAAKCGIASHSKIEGFLASPDGLIGDLGLWEGKAPTQGVHLEYFKGQSIPEEYVPQCLSQLACCPERDWLDFTSFHPDFPPKLQVFVAPRMYRKDWLQQIAEIEDGARKALHEIATLTAELQELAEKRVM
jgi:hypothetical protein